MKQLLFFLSLLIANMACYAQSERSDSLFAKGVERYKAGLFSEALPFFEESDKLDKLELDSLNDRRYYSSVWLASCYYRLGDESAAAEIDPYNYRFEPIDRRETLAIDSVSALVGIAIRNQDVYGTLEKAKLLSRLEHEKFDSDHNTHINTYRILGGCYLNLGNLEEVLSTTEEALRLIRLNFGETTPLQTEELYLLFDLYAGTMRWEEATRIHNWMRNVVAANFDVSHPANLDVAYCGMIIRRGLMKWEEASQELPSYFEIIRNCCKDNPENFNKAVLTIRELFNSCGRSKECQYIDRLSQEYAPEESSPVSKLENNLLKILGEFEVKDFDAALNSINGLTPLILELPAGERKEFEAMRDCLRCTYFLATNQMDEAKFLYLDMQDAGYDDILENSQLVRPSYLSVKMMMSTVLADYEGALEAIDMQLKGLPDDSLTNKLMLFSYQSCLLSMAGNYAKAMKVTKDAVSLWENEVVDRKALYRCEKDTAQINAITGLIENYIRNTYNLPDSASYSMREIKSEYLALKSRMLKNFPLYEFNLDYLDVIKDLTREALMMKKYPEAQEIMNRWIGEWYERYKTFDPDSEDTDAQLDRIFGLMILDDALVFRSAYCYEKGDPAGKDAYGDLFRYLDYEYGSFREAEPYRRAKIRYYKYMDDDDGLIQYLTSFINSDTSDNDAELCITLAEALERAGDFETAIPYRKKIVSSLINEGLVDEDSERTILDAVKAISSDNKKIDRSSDVYDWFEKEFCPSLDLVPDSHFRLLVKAVNELRYSTFDERLLTILEKEIMRVPVIFKSPYSKAILYQAMGAWAVKDEEGSQKGMEYLNKARDMVNDDEVLSLLFDTYIHNALYGNKYAYDFDKSEVDQEMGLVKAFITNGKFLNTHEFVSLVKRVTDELLEKGEYREVVRIGETCLSSAGNEDFDLLKVFDSRHPLYDELAFLNQNLLQSFSVLDISRIKKNVFEASSLLAPDKAAEYAIEIIKDGYESLERSMDTNYFYSWKCDELVSNTSRYADFFQTDSLKMYAYDTSLFCKGLQMRSSNAVRALILSSGHKGALRKFDELQAIIKSMESSGKESFDSLQKRRNVLERELVRMSSSFGDYKNLLRASWRDVRSSLTERDLAVEFTLASGMYGDVNPKIYREGYYACILRKDMDVPEVVYLGDLKIDYSFDIYTSTDIGVKLLKPLEPYLDGINNIYYSPIGDINRIALESLPLPNDSDNTLSSKYNIYRLSSTREVIGNSLPPAGRDAVIYGGLQYNLSLEELENDSKKYQRSSVALGEGYFLDSEIDELRGLLRNIPYLAGTLMEAENISSTINSSPMSTMRAVSLTGPEGTEASFKALDGKQTRLIHIATHGFYFNSEDYKKIKKEDSASGKDRSLIRSGLFFAGATNRYRGLEIPEGIDDGILTSEEISNLDLTGLDLCVLSACQTAQGDISSEGVYGLQRGFKIAGAKSLLMSLWPVDDEATSFLMTEFYQGLVIEGKSKYQALESAKKAVRNRVDKGWEDPRFWAAFVLLDAID